jgi:hypothetical protein
VLERHDETRLNSWDSNGVIDNFQISGSSARLKFREFFRNYRLGSVYHYREALLRHWSQGIFYIEVNLAHVYEYDDILLNSLQVRYAEYMNFSDVVNRLDRVISYHSLKREQKMLFNIF